VCHWLDSQAARLGYALVLVPMLAVGAFLAGLKWQHAAVFTLAGIMLVGAVFYPPVSKHILKPYQREGLRLSCTRDDARARATNCCSRKLPWVPVASGVKGLARQSESTGLHSVRYSDFIMSAWAEEQGFKGVLLALGLYMRFCYD